MERREMEIKSGRERNTSINRSKTRIEDEKNYANSFSSVIMFRYRTNTLKLNWRNQFQGGPVVYTLCGHQMEET